MRQVAAIIDRIHDRKNVFEKPILSKVAVAVGFAVVCWSYLSAEADLRQAIQRNRSLQEANDVSSRLGWQLPDIPLVAADGTQTSSHAVFSGGEGIVIFTATCPHCQDQAPSWPRIHNRLATEGNRLVLLSPDPYIETGPFLQRFGITELATWQVVETEDLYRLGAVAVPHFLRLDNRRRVIEQYGIADNASFDDSLILMDRFAPGSAAAARKGIVDALLGEGTTLGQLRKEINGVTALDIDAPSGLHVLWMIPATTETAERVSVALMLDQNDKIRKILPTAWNLNQLASAVPHRGFFDPLIGRDLASALDFSATAARQEDEAAAHWKALNPLLARLQQAQRTPD